MIDRSILRFMLGMSLMLPVAAHADVFTLVILPDTQNYAELHPEVVEAQIDWIVANQASENIAYVAHLGDLKDDQDCDNLVINVGTGAGRTEWQILDDAFVDLDVAGIPYGVVPGNHDFDQPTTGPNVGGCPNWDDERPLDTYNTVFGPNRFSGGPFYGDPGGLVPGNRVANSNEDSFTLFESNGVKFIAINLAYKEQPDAIGLGNPELAWADNLLKSYPDRLGILTSHYFMEANPGNSLGPYGQEVYDALAATNPNFFLMLSAHKRGEAWATEITSRGAFQPVQVILADYQDYAYPGDGDPGTPANMPNPANIDFSNNTGSGFRDSGYMRRMKFDTMNGTVELETFLPPVAFKGRTQTIVSDYFPADGTGMDDGTASNLGFSYLGYTVAPMAFNIFECDDVAGGTCDSLIGSIAFPSNSGTQTDGTGITLTYTCTGTFCDSAGYDEDSIRNVDWTLNAGTGELTALTMRLDTDPGCLPGTTPLPCSQTAVNFSFISTGLTANDASGGSCEVGPSGPQCISGISINGANQFVPQ